MFAILQEQAGRQHWIRIDGAFRRFIAVLGGPPPEDLQYSDHNVAERDADVLLALNARAVERTKRRRKYKEEPATYTVVPVNEYERFIRERGKEEAA